MALVPTTTCVYFFKNEFEELLQRIIQEPLNNGVYCCLHGLWTHGSNPVVYLIVSNQEEHKKAQAHQLNCVGYAAKKYTPTLHYKVSDDNKISAERQHLVIDVNKTKRDKSLHAFASHPRIQGDPIQEGREPLKVIILDNDDSPFRKELCKLHEESRGKRGENRGDSRESRGGSRGESRGESGQGIVDQNESGQRKVDQNESETVQLHNNQENSLVDVTSVPKGSIVDRIMHKIKYEFDPDEIRKTSQILFTHNDRNWKIQLEPKQGGDETSVTIYCPQHTEGFSTPAVHESRLVVQKIKHLCQCTKCRG